jgi:hypothetical protein
MKKLIVLVVLGLAAFWGWDYYSERSTADPVYVELRVKHARSGIELVGVGRMNSPRDCERRAATIWRRVLVSDDKTDQVTVACMNDIAPRFDKMFANQPSHATYIALDRGSRGERDARLIIYGAPASEVGKVCPSLIERLKRNYQGQVQCILGTVG